MITPILETERLILRPLSVEDAEEIYQNWTSDPDVAKYMRWNLHKGSGETAEWLKAEVENIGSIFNYTWCFKRKDTGELIGSGGLVYKEDRKMFELGYNIMKKYWNLGYTTEAVKRIVDFAFSRLEEKQLFSCHAKENTASGKVMRKAGFKYLEEGSYSSFDNTRTYVTDNYILNAAETDSCSKYIQTF